MAKTRIVMLTPDHLSGEAGGMGRMAEYTLSALEAAGEPVELQVFATRLVRKAGLKHVSSLWALGRFVALLAMAPPDLVHVNVAPKGSTWRKAVFAWIAHRFEVPVVLHLHGAGYDEYFAARRPMAQRFIRAFFGRAQGVIVLGAGWRDWAVSPGGLRLDRDRVHVIDNGVPDPGVRAGHDNRVPRILFVGLVGRRKGVDTLLEALALLPAGAEWTCAICGNGEVATHEAQARRLGLGPGRVVFAGWQDAAQVRGQMGRSDVFVLPSRAENQPVAILEAMAVGLPVVSTAVGDIPNQVIDGVTGWVVPRDDPAGLAAALAALVTDAGLRRKMGAAGRARYDAAYSSAINLERTLAVYRRIAG